MVKRTEASAANLVERVRTGFRGQMVAILGVTTAALLFAGCSESVQIPHAECANGARQELTCGVLGYGTQQQICVDFFWVNDGTCSEQLVCQPGEKRSIPCGLNLEGERQELCGKNQWQELSACDAKDVCTNGEVKPEACGHNLRGELDVACEDGAWKVRECDDPDVCVDNDVEPEACDELENLFKTRTCVEGMWSNWSGCQASTCEEGSIKYDPCGFEDRGRVVSKCVGGQWNSSFECEAMAKRVVMNDGVTFVVAEDNSLWVTGGNGVPIAGPTRQDAPIGWLRQPFTQTVYIASPDHFALAKEHACAIFSGEVHCWGNNLHGQVNPDRSMITVDEPLRVQGVGTAANRAVQVVTNALVSCALLEDESVRCWGRNGSGGGVGVGVTGEFYPPIQPAGITFPVRRIFAREHVVCAELLGNHVHCWGDNIATWRAKALPPSCVLPWSQEPTIGVLETCRRSRDLLHPTEWPRLRRQGFSLVDLAAFQHNGCAFYSDGAVTCWGENNFGQAANGTKNRVFVPKTALSSAGTIQVREFVSSPERRCARMSDDSILCWGRQQLDDPNARLITDGADAIVEPRPTLRFYAPTDPVATLALTDARACAVLESARLVCTGVGKNGQLGRGATKQSIGSALPVLWPSETLDAP